MGGNNQDLSPADDFFPERLGLGHESGIADANDLIEQREPPADKALRSQTPASAASPNRSAICPKDALATVDWHRLIARQRPSKNMKNSLRDSLATSVHEYASSDLAA
jgi:hypothetical protein